MGFATGFTGGVTLTLSLAYLSVLAHQRSREEQCRSLRAQALALRSLVDPIPQPLPLSRSEIAARQRAASIEVAKDRWNDEVENAVRWVQSTDWEEVREGLEAHAAALWRRAFGEPAAQAEKVDGKLESLATKTRPAVGETGGSITAAAKGALSRARETGKEIESTVEGKALEARLAGRKGLSKMGDDAQYKAAEAQGVIASALERGRDKAQEMVGKVKSAVGMSGDEAAIAADGKAEPGGKAPSAVEKALGQRYQKADARMNRAAAEVLKERYTPMDQRDNTVLRGL